MTVNPILCRKVLPQIDGSVAGIAVEDPGPSSYLECGEKATPLDAAKLVWLRTVWNWDLDLAGSKAAVRMSCEVQNKEENVLEKFFVFKPMRSAGALR